MLVRKFVLTRAKHGRRQKQPLKTGSTPAQPVRHTGLKARQNRSMISAPDKITALKRCLLTSQRSETSGKNKKSQCVTSNIRKWHFDTAEQSLTDLYPWHHQYPQWHQKTLCVLTYKETNKPPVMIRIRLVRITCHVCLMVVYQTWL